MTPQKKQNPRWYTSVRCVEVVKGHFDLGISKGFREWVPSELRPNDK